VLFGLEVWALLWVLLLGSISSFQGPGEVVVMGAKAVRCLGLLMGLIVDCGCLLCGSHDRGLQLVAEWGLVSQLIV